MLDKKTHQRIITDAETHTNEFEAQILGKPDTSNKESYLNGREDGYIAGASAEAERAQCLVEALEKAQAKVNALIQEDSKGRAIEVAIIMANILNEISQINAEALTKYNQSK